MSGYEKGENTHHITLYEAQFTKKKLILKPFALFIIVRHATTINFYI